MSRFSQTQTWNGQFTFVVLCGISVADLLSSPKLNDDVESRMEELGVDGDFQARSSVRAEVLNALAAAKSVINSSWFDACSKQQRVVSFQPHEAPITPSLPPKWHRHMTQPLFSRCSVLPLACTPHIMQLLVAGGASIQTQVPSPSRSSYPTATIVAVSSEMHKSGGAHSPDITLLASLGFPVVYSTFFEDWAQNAAPPPHSKHELPEAKAAAATQSAAEAVAASVSHVSADLVPLSADSAVSTVFRHTDKKNAKCSICRGAAVLGSAGMHMVDIVDTSTSGHLACFQWLCGHAFPNLPAVQVVP